MIEINRVDDFIKSFENMSKDEKKEIIRKLMPKFCRIVMENKDIIQEIMPECMEMMKGIDLPMKEMMFKMMGKFWNSWGVKKTRRFL